MNLSDNSRIFRRPRSASGFVRRFGAQDNGVIATEFALIAPILIAMYFGVTEFSDVYTVKSKVTAVASTAGDLIAQEASVCDAEKTDTFAALSAIMFPYALNNMQIKISSLIDNGNNGVKVAWSDAQNTTARTVNSVVPIPAGLVVNASGGSVIFVEVTYNYSSPAGHLIYGSLALSDQFYLRPRLVAQVARSANSC